MINVQVPLKVFLVVHHHHLPQKNLFWSQAAIAQVIIQNHQAFLQAHLPLLLTNICLTMIVFVIMFQAPQILLVVAPPVAAHQNIHGPQAALQYLCQYLQLLVHQAVFHQANKVHHHRLHHNKSC